MLNDMKKLNEICRLMENSAAYTIQDSKGSIDNYVYFIYPFKGITIVEPKYEHYAADLLQELIDKQPDLFLTLESDGISITKLLSDRTKIPYLAAKRFHYKQPAIEFIQKSGYYSRTMYVPREIEGHKIALIDAVISTGGTMITLSQTLKNNDIEITGIYSVVNKPQYKGSEKLAKIGINCKSLVDVTIKDSMVKCVPSKATLKILNDKNELEKS